MSSIQVAGRISRPEENICASRIDIRAKSAITV